MTLNVFQTHFQFKTTHTFASIETDALVGGICQLSKMGFGLVGGGKKISFTGLTMLGGFGTSLVGFSKIVAVGLLTGATSALGLTVVLSLMIIGGEEVGTEKNWTQKKTGTLVMTS